MKDARHMHKESEGVFYPAKIPGKPPASDGMDFNWYGRRIRGKEIPGALMGYYFSGLSDRE